MPVSANCEIQFRGFPYVWRGTVPPTGWERSFPPPDSGEKTFCTPIVLGVQ